jgi:Tat protein secretion system quality control protein TatD with DNase activity
MHATLQPPKQQHQTLQVSCQKTERKCQISFGCGQKLLTNAFSCRLSTQHTRMPPALQDIPLFFTAGVHPHNAKDCTDSTLQELRQLAAHERCVAVGG